MRVVAAALPEDLLQLLEDGLQAGQTELPAEAAVLVGVSETLGGAEQVGRPPSLGVVTGLAPVQAVPEVEAEVRDGPAHVGPHPALPSVSPEVSPVQVSLQAQVVGGHGETGGGSGQGQHRVGGRGEPLAPPGQVLRAGVEVQRAEHDAPVEVDLEVVPERAEGTAVLGVTALLLLARPGGVAEADPLPLRPQPGRRLLHEGLHGDDGVVLGQDAHVEDRVPGQQLHFITTTGVSDPRREHQGPVERFWFIKCHENSPSTANLLRPALKARLPRN